MIKPAPRKSTPAPAAPTALLSPQYTLLLWGIFFVNALFLIWQCLDRYLAPRFLFLSIVLLLGGITIGRDLWKKANWRWNSFDVLLLVWYFFNLATAFYAFNWSEGIFYSQKVLLLFTVYWLVRQILQIDEHGFRQRLAPIITFLTWVVALLLSVQLGMALSEHGLDNQTLYNYATGVFGNKSLASDFLFFLLALTLYVRKEIRSSFVFYLNLGLLLGLILVLQTRTVYLAVFASALLYILGIGILDQQHRAKLLKRGLLFAVVLVVILAGIALKSGSGGIAERLNPLTYLESATANERRFVWYKTDLLNADHYWWGVGSGSWKIWLPSKSLEGAFRLQEKGIVFTRAHNDYLEIRAEMGIVGAVYFIALFVLAALSLLWALRRHADKREEILAIAAGLLGYCVIQYLDFPRERIEMQVILALFFALSVHYGAGFWEKTLHLELGKAKMVFAGLLMIGLGYNTVIGAYRVNGEIHNVKMAQAYQRSDYTLAAREAKLAYNPFYQYNDVVIPFQWYEGTAYFKTNKMEDAVRSFEIATALNPWSFQVINNYATALASLKKYDEAITYFEKAVAINPKYDEGKFNLAYSFTQLGQYQKALDWVAKVDTMPGPSTDEDRKKNKSILDNKSNFERNIRAKMGQ